MNIIQCGEHPDGHNVNEVGGKGLNSLKLYQASLVSESYNVPEFFIIPSGSIKTTSDNEEGVFANFKDDGVRDYFDKIDKPAIVRSSSSLEDGVKATFAGMFESISGVKTFDELRKAVHQVDISKCSDSVINHAKKLGVPYNEDMAIIVQKEITNPMLKGIIQLEENEAILEGFEDGQGRDIVKIGYEYLNSLHKDFEDVTEYTKEARDYIAEFDNYYLMEAARKAKNQLGLEGIVQVEFCFTPGKKADFVQIRKLPRLKSHAEEISLEVPECATYIESEICNGVPGEITLPAYVTVSQSGFKRILIETGQAYVIGCGSKDEKAEDFYKNSKLSQNNDYREFRELVPSENFERLEKLMLYYNEIWKRGNKLFEDYILVCDKLDETYCGMHDLTTNKRAIITALEAEQISHAMTVARELGIPCMGVEGIGRGGKNDSHKLDYFYHQVETGDLIHMKSDGKKAVAYIQKKRDSDPYEK